MGSLPCSLTPLFWYFPSLDIAHIVRVYTASFCAILSDCQVFVRALSSSSMDISAQLRRPAEGRDPRYVRIAEQIRGSMDSGELAAGDRLPSIRSLARRATGQS